MGGAEWFNLTKKGESCWASKVTQPECREAVGSEAAAALRPKRVAESQAS